MDDEKICSKCGIISIKNNFQINRTKNDGLRSNCKVYRKNS